MRLTTLAGAAPGDGELLEAASGKLALLGKLLPKLRREGRKVLIFSQFKIMLNVVSDYLDLLALPYERIDGDTAGAPPRPVPACLLRCTLQQFGRSSRSWRST